MTAPVYIPKAIHNGNGTQILDPGDAGSIYVDRNPCFCALTSAGAETRTLAVPTKVDDRLLLCMRADGGDITLTVTGGFNEDADTTFTFSDPGQFAVFEAIDIGGTLTWRKTSDYSTGNITPTEAAWLDGVTPGTAAASKAMVTNSSNTIGSLTALAIGGAVPTNPQSILAVEQPAVTATANQSYYQVAIQNSAATTVPTGTAPLVASLFVDEPNITATGTVTAAATVYIKAAPTEGGLNYALFVDAGVTRLDGNIDASAAAWSIVGIANTAAAVNITDGTTSLVAIDTRNTVTVQNIILQGPAAQTLPNGASSRARIVSIPDKTITLVGQTQVTTANLGVQLYVGAPTIAQSGGAVTVDRASSLHVGTLVAGSSVTVTANHIISTDTSGCFCTAAGVWTDTACWEYGKEFVNRTADQATDAVLAVLSVLTPATWKYRDEFTVDDGMGKLTPIKMNDRNRDRVGLVYDDLPEALRAPGEESAVSGSLLASFALAAVKVLYDRVQALEAKLAQP